MYTFNEAKVIFDRCRDKSRGACLGGRSTRLVQSGVNYGIQYHGTIVVTISQDDSYTLNSGGYFTKTTKERINEFSPVRIFQSKHVWYIGDFDKKIQYFDGMRVSKRGKVLNASKNTQTKRIENTLKKIDGYVNKYSKALEAKTIPAPSGGDCWACCMRDVKTGKTVMGNDHLTRHIDEGYLVPSLLILAIEAKGYNPSFVNPWNGLTTSISTFKRALKDYMRKELCK